MNQWKSYIAYAQGISHKQNDTVCQDRVFALESEQINVIALADGGGSYSHSEEGAAIITKAISKHIADNYDVVYSDNEENIAKKLSELMSSELIKYATEKEYELDDLSSTFLLVAVNQLNNTYISIHLGDGVIGVNQNQKLILHSAPHNGDAPNITFMTTSDDLNQHIRVQRGSLENVNGFTLMSDGAAHVLFAYKVQVFTNNAQIIINHAIEGKMTSELIDTFTHDFLVPRCLVFDDCSIAILVNSHENAIEV